MARRGKNINVYLMDGEADGRIKATISNWIGVAFKIPRSRLSLCRERDELTQSSVYFLFGHSEGCEKDAVYIGQAGVRKAGGGILVRLMEHDKNPEKDYWTDAVVFTTTNNSMGPTELSYLENRFCNMALEAGRYEVKNSIDPTPGNITEEKESELEEFSDYAELILGVLGYKVFQHKMNSEPEHVSQKKEEKPKAKGFELPALPDQSMRIGSYVRKAMENLSNSGYRFTEQEIDLMCSREWSKKQLNLNFPFMRSYIKGKTTAKDEKGNNRYWIQPYTFGNIQVLISSQWYDSHFEVFNQWYQQLK